MEDINMARKAIKSKSAADLRALEKACKESKKRISKIAAAHKKRLKQLCGHV